MYYRARWYDPAIGRFISEDPIGFEAGDINLFGYVQNKPVTHTDPSGLIDPLVYQDPRIYGSHPLSSEELENLQTGLDCLGAFPFLGEPFDALSGVVSYARGDYTGVTLSAASTIPFLGWGTGATKIARRADNVLPEGGVYKLIRRETGETVRAGQTNNLLRRRAEHARDPKLAEYDFVPIFRTNNYNERRGLEQILYNDSPGA
jgi:uncharacterized protein RhaS with RHS repeats